MSNNLRLRIVTPESTLVDTEVRTVRFRGLDGEYGIQANHAPLMTGTAPGVLHYEAADGEDKKLIVTEGFVEIRDNTMSVICEAGEDLHEIDLERARAAEQRARERLRDRASLQSEDVIRAEAALRRALARQLAAGGRREGRADI